MRSCLLATPAIVSAVQKIQRAIDLPETPQLKNQIGL
jgi:hypothetical protein